MCIRDRLKGKLAAAEAARRAAEQDEGETEGETAPRDMEAAATPVLDLGPEYQELKRVADSQIACYKDDIRYMTESIKKLTTWMRECLAM